LATSRPTNRLPDRREVPLGHNRVEVAAEVPQQDRIARNDEAQRGHGVTCHGLVVAGEGALSILPVGTR